MPSPTVEEMEMYAECILPVSDHEEQEQSLDEMYAELLIEEEAKMLEELPARLAEVFTLMESVNKQVCRNCMMVYDCPDRSRTATECAYEARCNVC